MAKEPIEITYHFICDGDGPKPVEKTCTVRMDSETLETTHATDPAPPNWARLEVCQCDVCPLRPDEHPHCPAALSFVEILEEFGDILSFSNVEATVTTSQRTISAKTTMQKALSSLVGLRMATCGCPVLVKFRPMARYHLPFATTNETVYRAVSSYLLAQYFLRQKGKDADLDLGGLRKIYDDIHEVNIFLADRLRTIPAGDAHLNALVILDLFTLAMPHSIEAKLAEIEHMFAPYLESE